jgi:hypothetical protein
MRATGAGVEHSSFANFSDVRITHSSYGEDLKLLNIIASEHGERTKCKPTSTQAGAHKIAQRYGNYCLHLFVHASHVNLNCLPVAGTQPLGSCPNSASSVGRALNVTGARAGRTLKRWHSAPRTPCLYATTSAGIVHRFWSVPPPGTGSCLCA